MKVILLNLPSTAHQQQLDDFLGKFRRYCGAVHVVDKEVKDTGWVRYAWAEFETDKYAAKAIKQLNGNYINDSQVALHEMVERHVDNERRAPNHAMADAARDQRQADRRTYGNAALRYTHELDRASYEGDTYGIAVDEIDEAELRKILYGKN